MAERTPIEERFWSKVDRREPDDCWPWTGSHVSGGYGNFWDGAKVVYAHRWAYQHFVGPIPEGLDIDHLCHNADTGCAGGWACPHRPCVNFLTHLEPASRSLNLARGQAGRWLAAVQAAKTHCPQGHPYDEANTYWWGKHRHCRTCLGLRPL